MGQEISGVKTARATHGRMMVKELSGLGKGGTRTIGRCESVKQSMSATAS